MSNAFWAFSILCVINTKFGDFGFAYIYGALAIVTCASDLHDMAIFRRLVKRRGED
jgi:hypothetical protein